MRRTGLRLLGLLHALLAFLHTLLPQCSHLLAILILLIGSEHTEDLAVEISERVAIERASGWMRLRVLADKPLHLLPLLI